MGRWRQGVGFLLKGLLICASFAAVFAITYQLNAAYLREAADTVNVVVASEDLPPGVELTPSMLRVMEKPAFGLGDDYLIDIDALFESGAWYIDEIGLRAGETLRPGQLKHESAFVGDWRFQLERGSYRMIAVETSLARSSGDWLWPGVIVDAMAYIPAKDSYDDPRPSLIIGPEDDPCLRGLLVIDKKNSGGVALADRERIDEYNRDQIPAVITFMMEEKDIERIKALIRYNEEGRIYLSPTSRAIPDPVVSKDDIPLSFYPDAQAESVEEENDNIADQQMK